VSNTFFISVTFPLAS